MATCFHCKTEETQLYENGVPICLRCANSPPIKHKPPATDRDIGAELLQNMLRAVSLNEEAANEFDHAVSQTRTGAQHQDGAQQIKDASSKLSQTREEMMAAHTRLNNFIEHGIVPEDMKRTG